jgi:hypothetical protein
MRPWAFYPGPLPCSSTLDEHLLLADRPMGSPSPLIVDGVASSHRTDHRLTAVAGKMGAWGLPPGGLAVGASAVWAT